MSYHLSDNDHYRLTQARDVIRLLKQSSQNAEPDAMIETALIASYLTLIDEQVSAVIATLDHTQ